MLHEWDLNSQLYWWYALIVPIVMNVTSIRLWLKSPLLCIRIIILKQFYTVIVNNSTTINKINNLLLLYLKKLRKNTERQIFSCKSTSYIFKLNVLTFNTDRYPSWLRISNMLRYYSQACIKRSHLGQRKSGPLRQVTSWKRLNSYKCSMTGQE
jgi:hypothetical protein